MNNADKLRLILSILLSVLTVLVGAVFIGEIADLYYGGIAKDPSAPAYTPEALRSHLIAPFVCLFILIAAIICAYVVFEIYPAKQERVRVRDDSKTLRSLLKRTPKSSTSSQFIAAKAGIKSANRTRAIVWSAAFAVCIAGAIYILVYLLDPAHFHPDDLHGDAMNLCRHVISFIGAGVVALLAAGAYESYLLKRELDFVKIAVKTGDRDSLPTPSVKRPMSKATKSTLLWTTRAAVAAIAIAFIVEGARNGGANDVLVKAINICTECIGLG